MRRSVDQATVAEALVDVDEATLRRHAARIRAALRLADLSVNKACLHMGGLDQAQFSRQLEGIGHLSVTRLMRLPRPFWQWYAVLTLQAEGLPPELRRAARTMFCLLARRERRRPRRHERREAS